MNINFTSVINKKQKGGGRLLIKKFFVKKKIQQIPFVLESARIYAKFRNLKAKMKSITTEDIINPSRLDPG